MDTDKKDSGGQRLARATAWFCINHQAGLVVERRRKRTNGAEFEPREAYGVRGACSRCLRAGSGQAGEKPCWTSFSLFPFVQLPGRGIAIISPKKTPHPCRVRLCLGTWLDHLGQAGCFRLPIKACRLRPSLCVRYRFDLQSEFFSRCPRTGQGKFTFKPGKEHGSFCRIIRAS